MSTFPANMLLLVRVSDRELLIVLTRRGAVVGERRWEAGPTAGRELLSKIQELLAEHALGLTDVTRIAVNAGPVKRASALRAAVTVVNLLAYAGKSEVVQADGETVPVMLQEALSATPIGFVAPKY